MNIIINDKEENMNINYKTKKYGLIGNPISKTLSPFIHNKFYEKNNINSIYLTFEVENRDFEKVLESFKVLGIEGFNITIPYKEKIIKYLDKIDPLAEKINAINTVDIVDNKMIGYNTDGLGFLKSLELNDIDLKDKKVLVLGAGGGSRAVTISLLEKEIGKLYITNRTSNRGIKLVSELKNIYKDRNIEFTGFNLSELNKEEIDIVINTTSVGMYPKIDESPMEFIGFKKNLILYDLIYKPIESKFLKEGKKLGYKTINGLEMLYYQGIEAQKIWNKREEFLGLEELIEELKLQVEES